MKSPSRTLFSTRKSEKNAKWSDNSVGLFLVRRGPIRSPIGLDSVRSDSDGLRRSQKGVKVASDCFWSPSESDRTPTESVGVRKWSVGRPTESVGPEVILYTCRVVVVFIQHLAFCDLVNAVANIVPGLISIILNFGLRKKFWICLRFFIGYYISLVGTFLVVSMALGKLLLLKYPLRLTLRSWSRSYAHKICAVILPGCAAPLYVSLRFNNKAWGPQATVIWIALLSVPTLHLVIDSNDVTFDYRVYSSSYNYSADIWKILLPLHAVILLLAPNITIIVATILLLVEAKKVVRGQNESLKWQGIVTVFSTATVYTISYLPTFIYLMIGLFFETDPAAEPGPYILKGYRIVCCIFNINILANFFIYSITVASFRNFLKESMWRIYNFFFAKTPLNFIIMNMNCTAFVSCTSNTRKFSLSFV